MAGDAQTEVLQKALALRRMHENLNCGVAEAKIGKQSWTSSTISTGDVVAAAEAATVAYAATAAAALQGGHALRGAVADVDGGAPLEGSVFDGKLSLAAIIPWSGPSEEDIRRLANAVAFLREDYLEDDCNSDSEARSHLPTHDTDMMIQPMSPGRPSCPSSPTSPQVPVLRLHLVPEASPQLSWQACRQRSPCIRPPQSSTGGACERYLRVQGPVDGLCSASAGVPCRAPQATAVLQTASPLPGTQAPPGPTRAMHPVSASPAPPMRARALSPVPGSRCDELSPRGVAATPIPDSAPNSLRSPSQGLRVAPPIVRIGQATPGALSPRTSRGPLQARESRPIPTVDVNLFSDVQTFHTAPQRTVAVPERELSPFARCGAAAPQEASPPSSAHSSRPRELSSQPRRIIASAGGSQASATPAFGSTQHRPAFQAQTRTPSVSSASAHSGTAHQAMLQPGMATQASTGARGAATPRAYPAGSGTPVQPYWAPTANGIMQRGDWTPRGSSSNTLASGGGDSLWTPRGSSAGALPAGCLSPRTVASCAPLSSSGLVRTATPTAGTPIGSMRAAVGPTVVRISLQ